MFVQMHSYFTKKLFPNFNLFSFLSAKFKMHVLSLE